MENEKNANHINCENPINDKHHQQQEDAESIVSDRCWIARYKSDSRKWLLRDGISNNSEQLSTMKQTYEYPKHKSPIIGRRAKILLDKMLREAEVEAVEERANKPVIEEYITTYDDTFCTNIPNFEPKPLPRSRALYEKYPLYGNQGTSYWHFQHVKYVGDQRTIPGATGMADINNPFKKNTNFSKPLADLTDGGQLDR